MNHAQLNAVPLEEADGMGLRKESEMLQGSNRQAARDLGDAGREGEQLGRFKSFGQFAGMHVFAATRNDAPLDARKRRDALTDGRQIQEFVRHEKILEHVLIKSGERQGRRRGNGFRRGKRRLAFSWTSTGTYPVRLGAGLGRDAERWRFRNGRLFGDWVTGDFRDGTSGL
jgi:hypothetical protein